MTSLTCTTLRANIAVLFTAFIAAVVIESMYDGSKGGTEECRGGPLWRSNAYTSEIIPRQICNYNVSTTLLIINSYEVFTVKDIKQHKNTRVHFNTHLVT